MLSNVPAWSLATAFRTLANLLGSGEPLLRTLRELAESTPSGPWRAATERIGEQVAQGATLSAAMAAYPGLFDATCLAMVRAGEVGGVLDITAGLLADALQRDLTPVARQALFCDLLGLVLGAGAPLGPALDAAAGVLEPALRDGVRAIAAAQAQLGQPLAPRLAALGGFSPTVIQFVALGEEHRHLATLCRCAAQVLGSPQGRP